LYGQIKYPKPPLSFGMQTSFFQTAFGGALLLISQHLHRQCFLNLSICLITVLGKRKVHIVKVGKAVNTAFVNSNLPAWLRKLGILLNLLSHLETSG